MQCIKPIKVGSHPALSGIEGQSVVTVPCGKCVMCKVARSREWATRIIHESRYHKESVFLTLTYDDLHLPSDLSLHKKHLRNYFKRLRKKLEPRKIKVLACGEYGDPDEVWQRYEKTGVLDENYWVYLARGFARPHYHAIILGVALHEHKRTLEYRTKHGMLFRITGGPVYDAWRDHNLFNQVRGFVTLGSVTYNSARYCVSYLFKSFDKITNRKVYGKAEPPFMIVTRGLGEQYAIDNKEQLCYDMGLTVGGNEVGLPRYYQKKLLNTPELRNRYREKAKQKKEERDEFWRRKGVPEEKIYYVEADRRLQRAREVSFLANSKKSRL